MVKISKETSQEDVCIYMCMCVYTYIYSEGARQSEREREIERKYIYFKKLAHAIVDPEFKSAEQGNRLETQGTADHEVGV